MTRQVILILVLMTSVAGAEVFPKSRTQKEAPKDPAKSEPPIEFPQETKPSPTVAPEPAISAPVKSEPVVAAKIRAEVVKIDKRRDRVSVTDDPGHLWNKKDNVCIYRLNRPLACGKVIAVGIKGAVVQLSKHAPSLRPGDEARFFEPEKKMPDIVDEELTSEKILDVKPYSFTVALGYSLSLDLMFPIAHFYWSVSPTIAIGFQPAYVVEGGETPDAKITGFGGLLTANYFSEEYFRGFWVQFGSGFYRIKASQAGVEEVLNCPMVNVIMGWREDWAHGLNVGAGLGARFLSPLSGLVTNVGYKPIYPVAQVELGMSF